MNDINVIWWMIGICVVVTICLIFSKQLKIIVKIFINSIIGAAGLLVANYILAPFGLTVGINIVTALFIGILGIPGIVALYVMQLLFVK